MSSSLYWRPAPKNVPPARDLPESLKKRISQRLWGHDGSLNGDEIEIGKEMLPYLEGLDDAGAEGAADLIAAINAHGRVLLWIAN